jgi:hypothetical protein
VAGIGAVKKWRKVECPNFCHWQGLYYAGTSYHTVTVVSGSLGGRACRSCLVKHWHQVVVVVEKSQTS